MPAASFPEVCAENGHARASEMVEYLGVAKKTMYNYLREKESVYYNEGGLIFRRDGLTKL